ncbi:MAG TPA: bifunctional precorrin-2 dehydrogenase/sirohydrochlorin ferrochelatase [Candidatus Eisenbacteria bacterium]|nr:bifunctional precorrin-2 dehydrogenase/sirohydrochlorin ferrochelatase [Candidatus Eisenbacteria bacterium]
MAYYPIFLELQNRRCVVIGGGPPAEGKVAGLLAAGASVTVVTPEVTAELARRAQNGEITHNAKRYETGDLAGFEVVFAATDDEAVNSAVTHEARQRGVWINVADSPLRSDFILPSVLRRGGVTIAISTGGKSPALARMIREDVESHLPENLGLLLEVASQVREELRQRGLAVGYDLWREALRGEVRAQVERAGVAAAKEFLLKELEARACR